MSHSRYLILFLMSLGAQAAAPLYFNLGSFFHDLALYLLVAISLAAVFMAAKTKSVKMSAGLLFSLCFLGPPAYIVFSLKEASMSREREQKESEAGKQKNLEAFGRYCKGGKQVIYDRVPAKEELSIFVRIEKKFMGDEIEWGAHSYDEYFNAMSDLCKKTGIVYMEGMYSSYNKAKKGFDIEFRRHPICARAGEEWVVGSEIQSRYELVLGQTGRKDPAPWRGSLASSSIQIMDRQTGRVLAEDDMYFLSGHPSGADCPWGGGQLSELLVKVFGRSPLEVN